MISKKIGGYLIGGALLLLLPVFFITNPVIVSQKDNSDFIKAGASELRKHVGFLSCLEQGRAYDTGSLETSAQYIADSFTKHCDLMQEQTFMIQGKEYKNIICSFHPEGSDRLVIGAHYDTYNHLPGADDNASGVAGIIELARLLSVNKPDLHKRMDIVAYTLEEPPFFRTENMGSFHHASMLRSRDENVKAALVLEMIGYYSDQPGSQEMPIFLRPFYPDKGNFIAVIGDFNNVRLTRSIKKSLKQAMNIDVYSLNFFPALAGLDFSDHASYWKKGFRSVMITDTSFFRNKNYHTPYDTSDTLDYDRMADVIDGVYWAAINL